MGERRKGGGVSVRNSRSSSYSSSLCGGREQNESKIAKSTKDCPGFCFAGGGKKKASRRGRRRVGQIFCCFFVPFSVAFLVTGLKRGTRGTSGEALGEEGMERKQDGVVIRSVQTSPRTKKKKKMGYCGRLKEKKKVGDNGKGIGDETEDKGKDDEDDGGGGGGGDQRSFGFVLFCFVVFLTF